MLVKIFYDSLKWFCVNILLRAETGALPWVWGQSRLQQNILPSPWKKNFLGLDEFYEAGVLSGFHSEAFCARPIEISVQMKFLIPWWTVSEGWPPSVSAILQYLVSDSLPHSLLCPKTNEKKICASCRGFMIKALHMFQIHGSELTISLLSWPTIGPYKLYGTYTLRTRLFPVDFLHGSWQEYWASGYSLYSHGALRRFWECLGSGKAIHRATPMQPLRNVCASYLNFSVCMLSKGLDKGTLAPYPCRWTWFLISIYRPDWRAL